MIEGVDQAALLIALVFAIFNVNIRPWSSKTKRWYEAGREHVKISPPSWLFSIVWPLLYILQIVAGFLYFSSEETAVLQEARYNAALILFILQVLFCNLWYPMFFEFRRVIPSAILILLVLCAQLGVVICAGLDGKWVTLACMLPVHVWCLFALVLNCYWIYVSYKYERDLEEAVEKRNNRSKRSPQDLGYQSDFTVEEF